MGRGRRDLDMYCTVLYRNLRRALLGVCNTKLPLHGDGS